MNAITASAPSRAETAYRWPVALCLYAIACALMFFSYRDALAALSLTWWDSVEFGHGVLVPAVMAFAVWLDRERLAAIAPRVCPLGLGAVAASTLLWVVSRKLGVLVGEQTAMMLMLPALSWVLLGSRVTRALAFVFLFPFAASPLWKLINPVLQEATAWATTFMVRELGIPMYREGNYLTIASGRFHVASMCSGLRYFLAGLSLAAVFAFLNIRTVRHTGIMLLAGFLVAVLANWVRVTAIVVLGHVSEMQHPMIEDHMGLGWVLFTVSMVPLMLFGYWLARRADLLMPAAQHLPGEAVASEDGPGSPGAGLIGVWVLASAALIALGPMLDRPLDPHAVERVTARFHARLADLRVPGWQRSDQVDGAWAPRLSGAHGQRVVDFDQAGQRVSLYLGMYAGQRQGVEVVNDVNRLFNMTTYKVTPGDRVGTLGRTDDGLVAVESWIRPIASPAGKHDRLVWTTYRVVGQFQHHRLRAKLLQLEELWGATPVAFHVAISTSTKPTRELARGRLDDFLGAARPALDSLLRGIEGAF